MKSVVNRGLCAAQLVLLAACGGGGGGAEQPVQPAPQSQVTPVPSTTVAGEVDCQGEQCGALPDGVYAGHGVGSWRYANTSSQPLPVTVALSNVSGRTATLVLSNPGSTAMPLSADLAQSNILAPEPDNAIARFNHDGFLAYLAHPLRRSQSATAAVAPAQLGSTKSWVHADESVRVATLVRQLHGLDGRVVNLWLENAEGTKVDAALLDRLAGRIAGQRDAAYELVTGLVGPVWGAHGLGSLIAPDQPLDIVLLNFDGNAQPWGLLGYFWARNNFTTSANARSNAAVAVFLDTETLYLGGSQAFNSTLSTLAHELTHAANFYRRGVQMYTPTGSSGTFDTWLEEMSAMMAEDLLAARLTPGFNAIRDIRVRDWLATQAYNCDFTRYSASGSCNSYSVGGSLGAYLLRQYGLGFFRSLLSSRGDGDDVALLDAQLRAQGAELASAVRLWQTAVADLPLDSPAGFGMPARDEGDYLLPPIAPSQILPDNWTAAAPATLAAHGAFPWQRRGLGFRYSETVTLPPGAALTVLVH